MCEIRFRLNLLNQFAYVSVLLAATQQPPAASRQTADWGLYKMRTQKTALFSSSSTHRSRQRVAGRAVGHVLALEALELETVRPVQLVVVDAAAVAAQPARDDVRVVRPVCVCARNTNRRCHQFHIETTVITLQPPPTPTQMPACVWSSNVRCLVFYYALTGTVDSR